MSEIIKTEAVVLSKINYGDTSLIVSLYTKDYGKISVIVKGGRSPKSKTGFIVDPINNINVVIYSKDTRELQILSGADLISPFSRIKEDYDKLKYSHAVLELLKKLTVDHEVNERLYKGLVRILSLFETSDEPPVVIFGRFFLFFLTELGYEIQLEKCSGCGRTNLEGKDLAYNYGMGILCTDCRKEYLESYYISSELFYHLICLKKSKNKIKNNTAAAEKAVVFMEKYLMYHIPDFKGIQSLQLFN